MAAAFVACLSFGAVLAGIGNGLGAGYYDSDVVHPYLLTADLLRDWRSIFDWYHSPALYTFPDWLVAAGTNLLPLPNGWKPVVAGAALWLGQAVMIGAISAAVSQRSATAGMLAAAGVMAGAWTIQVAMAPESFSADFLSHLHKLHVHSGAVVGTLVNVAILLRFWCKIPTWTSAIIWGLLLSALVASDPLFFVWFVVPAIGVLAMDAVVRRSLTRWRLIALVAGVGLATLLVEMSLNSTRDDYLAYRLLPGQSLVMLARDIGRVIAQGDLLYVALLIGTACVLAAGAATAIAVRRARHMVPRDVFSLFAAFSIVSMGAAPILYGAYSHPAHSRYFGLLPAILTASLVVWIGHRPSRFARLAVAASLAGAAAWFAAQAGAGAAHIKALDAWASCLQDGGRRFGIGDYWTAKRAIFLSEGQLRFVQVRPDGITPFNFNYNGAWLRDPKDPGKALTADFIVTTGLEQENLQAVYGLPASVRQCGDDTVWLYDAPLEAAWKRPLID